MERTFLTGLSSMSTLAMIIFLASPVMGQTIGEFEYITEDQQAYQESHKVLPGENLYGIARQYGLSVDDVMRLNQLGSDRIYPGQRLIVKRPGATASENMRSRGMGAAATTTTNTVLPPMNGYADMERRQYYRVQEGESIADIAAKFRIHPDQIRNWNAVAQVHPGQTLVVDKWVEKVNMSDIRGREASSNLRLSRGQSTPGQTTTNPTSGERVGNLSSFSQGPFGESASTSSSENSYRTGLIRDTETVQDGDWLMERPTYREAEPQSSTWRTRGDNSGNQNSYQRTPNPVFETLEVSGPYEVLEDSYRGQENPFYAYHNDLPVGSKIEVQIPNNSGFIELEVIGQMPAGSRTMIGLSPSAARIIEGAGVYDQRVTLRY